MKTVLLVVYLLVDAQWVRGEAIDGWSPREQPSMEVCETRKNRSMANLPEKSRGLMRFECEQK